MKTKRWYQSKGIWAGMVTVGIGLLKLVDQQFATNLMDNQVVSLLIALFGALGIYGRKAADSKIE
jgi:hypothetical protein